MKDYGVVLDICQKCIKESFGKFYPQGAVDYFLYHHGRERVEKTIRAGETFLLYDDNNIPCGTISLTKNEIHRFFVLPQFQGKGYGSYMMNHCESEVFKTYETVKLDSALSSFNLYIKRGYIMDEFIAYPQDNGDFLCYFSMTKTRSE